MLNNFKILHITFLLCITIYKLHTIYAYETPAAKLEVVENGLRVSIPDENGVKYVAYNVNRNRPFKQFEQGQFSMQIRAPTDNRWSYEIKTVLNDDDVFYVWFSVQHNMVVYRSVAARYDIKSLKTDANEIRPIESTEKVTTPSTITVDRTTCEPSISFVTQRNENICKGELLFEENFNSPLDASIWKQEVRLPLNRDDAEFVLYNDTAEVSDGLLHIKPTLWNNDLPGPTLFSGDIDLGSRCTGEKNREFECRRRSTGLSTNLLPPVVTARINTKDSFSFKYGRVEIRARLPRGDWLVPLLLLEPLNNRDDPDSYASGQLRVAFARGNANLKVGRIKEYMTSFDGHFLYGGAVLKADSVLREKSMVKTRRNKEHFGANFHTYTLTWDNKKLDLAVNGQTYGKVEGPFSDIYKTNIDLYSTGEDIAPFDKEFFITLGVSVGGHGDFPDDSYDARYPDDRQKPWRNTSPKASLNFWRERAKWKPTWITPDLQVDYVRVYAI